MANISKLTLGSTTYTIKDTEARNKKVSQVLITTDDTHGTIAVKYADDSSGTATSIPGATTTKAGLMGALDKQKLDTLSSAVGTGIHYIGETSTAITDQSTVGTLTPKTSGSLAKTTNFITGDLVIYAQKEFIWTGSLWSEFGSTGSLKALAFKDSAQGTVTIPATNHTHSIPTLSHTVTQGDVSVSGSYTPSGSIVLQEEPLDGMHEMDSGYARGSGYRRLGEGFKILTDFETEPLSIRQVSGTTSVQSMTGVGTLPTSETKNIPNVTSVGKMFMATVDDNNETLVLTPGSAPTLGTAIAVNSMKSVGTLPTRQAVTVATAGGNVEFRAVSLIDWDAETATHLSILDLINATFNGTPKAFSATGKTLGITIANHAGGPTGSASTTQNATVTVS